MANPSLGARLENDFQGPALGTLVPTANIPGADFQAPQNFIDLIR
jgi:hypothetical protein